MNCELPDAQAGFRKGRGTRDQIVYQRSTSGGSSKKQESSRKISTKAFDCVNHKKLWKILQEMGIPEHLTYLLRILYADQEATVRNGHETTDWFQIQKGVCQSCILPPCFFNFYA